MNTLCLKIKMNRSVVLDMGFTNFPHQLQGYAVKAGVLIARGQKILFMDADGATRVSDVEKLEAELSKVATEGPSEIKSAGANGTRLSQS